jgi:hypothetical protein
MTMGAFLRQATGASEGEAWPASGHNGGRKPGEVIAPIIAGARARGIADAFEMLGEAAVLLDFHGCVLHVGEGAKPLIGCALAIAGVHLTAASRNSADALQRLLEAALSEASPGRLEEDLLCAEHGMRQRVRVYRVDNSGDTRQLLCAVLVLEPPRRVRRLRARPRSAAEVVA